MSKNNDESIGVIAVVLAAVLTLAHNFVFVPWMLCKIYSWYLQDFLGLGPMTWHVGFGILLMTAWFQMDLAKKTTKNDNVYDVIVNLGSMVAGMWLAFGFAWLCKDLVMLG